MTIEQDLRGNEARISHSRYFGPPGTVPALHGTHTDGYCGYMRSVNLIGLELLNPKQGCAGNGNWHGDEINNGNTSQDHDTAAKA